LLLKKRPCAWPEEDPFKLGTAPETLIPRLPWQTELGADGAQALTWKRRTATRHPEAVLLRPGAPLIDVAERFTRWDDRGTAFVTYRVDPNWEGGLWIGFKLCFVTEPKIELADLVAPTTAELAAMRRAQRYFAPRAHTLYIDMNGEAVRDAALIAILQRPYQSKGQGLSPPDVNLGSRPEIFAGIIAPSAFQQICRSVRDLAHIKLAAETEFAQQILVGAALAETDIKRRSDRLMRRQSAGDALARTEIDLIEKILPGILDPCIRLDAMGCFVVAQHPPEHRVHG
jgi:ATP-dependent helicase HepA